MSQKAKAVFFLTAVYIVMILGMAAKTLFDHYTRKVELELSAFIIPLLVSPLVYGTVFNAAKNSTDAVTMLIFGFQNGFFWQDVFGQLVKSAHGG
jgi:ABC-type sugar transport system permease subunit